MQGTISTILITISFVLLALKPAEAIKRQTPLLSVKKLIVSLPTQQETISPFELTYRAYQGRYKAQGISSFGSFKQDARTGEINSVKLVAAAIAAGELSTELANDQAYLNNLAFHLWRIARS